MSEFEAGFCQESQKREFDKLTSEEKHSAAWLKIKEHFKQRLTKYRKQNDGNLSFDETNKLRGRIAEIKYLLSLQDEN